MRHWLGGLLVFLLLAVGAEILIFSRLRQPIQRSASPNITPSLTASSSTKTIKEQWTPSAIGASTSAQYGTVSAALVRVRRTEADGFWGQPKDSAPLHFALDKQVEYFDRQETKNTPPILEKRVNRFPLEPGRVYLVEWRGKSTQNIQVWRISRLILYGQEQ